MVLIAKHGMMDNKMETLIKVEDYLNDVKVGKEYIIETSNRIRHNIKVLGKGYRCALVRNVENEDEFSVELKKVLWYKE